MKDRLNTWLLWLERRPVALINVAFIIIIASVFTYLLIRPIDVLKDWTLTLVTNTSTVLQGGKPVYHPGDSLIFKSSSTKLIDTPGITTRMIVCEKTATQAEREIQLDTLPATRPAGYNKPRDNAITVPDVSKFDGLPRTCVLHIDVCYDNVVLWRDLCESTETPSFVVTDEDLNPATIRQQIQDLNDKIKELENKLIAYESRSVATFSTATQSTTSAQPVSIPSPQLTPSATQTQSLTPSAQAPGLVRSILNGVGGLL